jgi:hypothetical protein
VRLLCVSVTFPLGGQGRASYRASVLFHLLAPFVVANAQIGTRICKHGVIGFTRGFHGGFLGRLPTVVLVGSFGTGLLGIARNFSTIERMPAAWRAAFSATSRVDVFISSPWSPAPPGKRDGIVKTVIREVWESPSPVRFARFAPTLS